MEFEHVLARDRVLLISHPYDGREYVRRRYIFSKSVGGLWSPLQDTPGGRLQRIVYPDWQGPIEKSIRLFGLILESRQRCTAGLDVGQALPQTRGYVECHVPRSKLFAITAGRQAIDSARYTHGLKKVAHPETIGWSDLPSPPGIVPENPGRDRLENGQTKRRRQRRRPLCQPPQQDNSDRSK